KRAGEMERVVADEERMLEALNVDCDPKVSVPSRSAVDMAQSDWDDADMDVNQAYAALKGPAEADKSDAYKKHEKALADAEKRLENAGKKIDSYVKSKAKAEASGDPPPHLTDRTIDAYEKAKADVARERNWLDNSPELAAFTKNLPALEKARDDALD